MAELQRLIGDQARAAAEPTAKVGDHVHYHAEGELLTACELDPDTDPEEEDPDNWVHSTARVGSVTCPACQIAIASKDIRAAHVAAGGMVADDCGWCRYHGYTPGQLLTAEGVPGAQPTPRLRLGSSHADIVYRQYGAEPAKTDPRVAIFMGPDAEAMAAAYVALANGGLR